MDIPLQTISRQKEAPLFEGIPEDAQRYHILYHSQGSLVLIYPTNIIVKYEAADLTLESVVQSIYSPISMPYIMQNGGITFTCEGNLMMTANVEELGKKKGQVSKIPIPGNQNGKINVSVTDFKEVSSESFIIALSNGQIWLHYNGKASTLFGFDTLREQIGEQKAYQVNSVDQQNGLILIADAFGRLSVMKLTPPQNIKVLFYEQISYNQIFSARWLSKDTLAYVTSDGQLTVARVIVNSLQKYELKKLSTVSALLEEVPNQFNFSSSQIMKQGMIIQTVGDNTLGIQWPEKIAYKINKRTGDKSVILQRKLGLFKITENDFTIAKSRVPLLTKPNSSFGVIDLVPVRQDSQMETSEPYIFYREGIRCIGLYQIFDGKKRQILDLDNIQGLHNGQEYQIVKLSYRLTEGGIYQILIQLQMCGEIGQMCLLISFDILRNLVVDSQQFFAQDSLLILHECAIANLQEDQKTLQFIALDQKYESRLPRVKVTLVQKVRQFFSTPFCDGMALVYDILGESQLRFSKNRLETNQVNDFSILNQTKYTFKLSFDERVSEVVWGSELRGAIVTNQRVAIVDSNLSLLSQYNLGNSIQVNRVIWFGDVALFSSERHLHYLTQSKIDNHTILMSFTSQQPCTIATALADRIVLSHINNQCETIFLNKGILMLDPLLNGYLSCLNLKDPQPDFALLKRMLTLLDSTLPISQSLTSKLKQLRFFHTAHFLGVDKLRVARALGQSDQVLEMLLGASDTDLLIHRLKSEVDYSKEKQDIREQMQAFMREGDFENAYKCAEVLYDCQSLLEIATKCENGLENVKERVDNGQFSTDANADICYLLEKGLKSKVKMPKAKKYGIPEERYKAWELPLKSNKAIQRQPTHCPDRELENLHRLNMGYDEAPFQYVAKVQEQDAFKVKFMHSVVNNNLANWVGVDSLIEDNEKLIPQSVVSSQNFGMAAFDFSQPKAQEGKIEEENDGAYLSNDQSPDDFDEKSYAVFYWRVDEGKGNQITDMTDNELHTKIDIKTYEWSDGPLEDGQPLDYEDKWGKQNQPSYSLQADGIDGESAKGFTLNGLEGAASKTKLENNFTLECWLRIDNAMSKNGLVLIQNEHIMIEIQNQSSLIVKTGTEQYKSDFQGFPMKTWNHIAIINTLSKGKIDFYINSNLAASINCKLKPRFSKSQHATFLGPQSLRISVTEIRFWSCNLPNQLLRENFRAPLAMLYEQKRAIKIKIKKKEGGSLQPAPGGGGLKKLGGFGKLAKPKAQIEELQRVEIFQQFKPQIEVKNDITKVQDDPVGFSSSPQVPQQQQAQPLDVFDFGFSNHEPVKQNTGFDFGSGYSSQAQQPFNDFMSFQQPSTPIQEETKDTIFTQKQSDFVEEEQKVQEISTTVKRITVPTSAIKRPSGEQQVLTIPRSMLQSNSISKQQESDDSTQSETVSPIKRVVVPSSEAAKVILWNIATDTKELSLISSIIENLTHSKLSETENLICQGFILCKQQLSTQKPLDKDQLKRNVRAFAILKLTHSLSLAIAKLKSSQSEDDLSHIASLSNMLIITQTPGLENDLHFKLKKQHLQFSLNVNMKLKNYAATSKIIGFYRKQLPETWQTDDERKKIDQMEAICKKYNFQNLGSRPGYYGSDCPHCRDPLIFGLATPQCQKCRSKIGLCYMTLSPLAADKAPRCSLCLAKFQSEQISVIKAQAKGGVLCPICNLSKID